jgi:hypothetical protein
MNMDDKEFQNHCLALKLNEKYLNFTEAAAEEEEDMDMEDND